MVCNKLTFHELLEQKNPTLGDRIRVMKQDAQDNWLRALGKNDVKHSMSVESNLNRLVPDDIKGTFDPAEIFVLLYAVYLHDIGYLIAKETHEKSSYDDIIDNFQKYKLNNRFEAEAVASVCYGHASEEEECQLKEINDRFGIAGLSDNPLNLRFLAALFRLADEIDNAYTRVIGYPDQKESMRHLIRFVDIDLAHWSICFQTEPTNSDEWEKLEGMRKYTQGRLDELMWVIESKGLLYNRIELKPEHIYNIINEQGAEQSIPFFAPESPPDVSRFRGRTIELMELCRMVENREARVIAITGQGGIGKSSLAAKLIKELERRNVPFESIFWRSLRYAPSFHEVADSLLIELSGGQIEPKQITNLGADIKINGIVRQLQQARHLVVLDNLEALFIPNVPSQVGRCADVDYRKLLYALSNKEHQSQVILTCRELPADVSARHHEFQPYPPAGLSGLTTDVAEQLLKDEGVRGNADEMCCFAEKARGHPFVLIQLAALVREDYDGDLSRFNSETLIFTNEVEDILAVQFGRLSESERTLLLRVAVYRKPVPLAGLLALKDGQTEREVKDIARTLRRRRLAQYEQETAHYSLHPLVQEYAFHQLENKQTVHQRAYEYYRAQPLLPVERWRDVDDVSPLLEAYHHACEVEDFGAAFKVLGDTMLYEALERWGQSRLLIEMYERLLPADWRTGGQRLKNPVAHMLILGNAGVEYHHLGCIQQAMEYLQKALEISQEIKDRKNESIWLSGLGGIYGDMGDKRKALEYYQRALAIAKEIGDWCEEGRLLESIGNAYDGLEQSRQAICYHRKSLDIAREHNDRREEGHRLGNLAVALIHSYQQQPFAPVPLGTINTAIQYWEQALAIAREAGDRRDEANQLIRLGAMLCNLNGCWMQTGLEYLHQGLSISREIEDKQTESVGLSNLGNAFFYCRGEWQQAIEYHRQAIEIARNIVFPHNEGYSLNSLGIIYCTQRQYQLALACFIRAAAVWRAISPAKLNEAECNIENLRRHLGEMYFAAVKAEVKANMATYLQQATGIADWTDEEVFINGNV